MERGYNENISNYTNVDQRAYLSNNLIPVGWNVRPSQAPEAVNKRRRRMVRVYEQARSARTGLFTLMLMADWAIKMAVRTEPNRAVRRQRRNILQSTWRRYSGDLVRQTGI